MKIFQKYPFDEQQIADIRSIVGQQLRKYRKAIALSQSDFGTLMGMEGTYISIIERGEISTGIDNIARFATFFGITVSQFLDPKFAVPTVQTMPVKARKIILAIHRDAESTAKQREDKIAAGEKVYQTGRSKLLHGLIADGFFSKSRTAKEVFLKLNREVKAKDLNADQIKEIANIGATLVRGRFIKLLDKLEPRPGSREVRFLEKTPGVIPYPMDAHGSTDLAADGE